VQHHEHQQNSHLLKEWKEFFVSKTNKLSTLNEVEHHQVLNIQYNQQYHSIKIDLPWQLLIINQIKKYPTSLKVAYKWVLHRVSEQKIVLVLQPLNQKIIFTFCAQTKNKTINQLYSMKWMVWERKRNRKREREWQCETCE
jgi:hypothetical protein